MTVIKYLRKTHDSDIGHIRTLTARDAAILVTLGYAEYHKPRVRRGKSINKKGGDNA
ncbi:hypothetical protein [Rouxiella badensis]|uniref:hypothetical protein n=1 Tax=Rouxiella badensis TaxID=1646377 RepID=UPI003C4149D3